MNIVYKITFLKRKEYGIFPYYYIGSKSNCKVIDGFVFNRKGKKYFGSSNYQNYNKIIEENMGFLLVEILYEGGSFKECMEVEREFHIKENVVMSPEYFNLSIATESNYADPNFATMRNVESGKICRVEKEHPDVKNGLWVGMTLGTSWYNDGVNSKTFQKDKVPEGWKLGRLGSFEGKNNGFFGKKHSPESLKRRVEKRQENGNYSAWNKGKKGVQVASAETKKKMSESQKKRSQEGRLNAMTGRRWVTNGFVNKTILPEEFIPEGWRFGQTKKKKL